MKSQILEIFCFMGCWSDAEAVKAPEGAGKLHPSLSQRPRNSWMSESKNGLSRVFLLLPNFLSEKSEKSEKEMKVKAQENLSINDANHSPKPQIVDQMNLSLIPLLEGATLGPVREGVGSQPKPGPSPPSVRVSTIA